MVTLPANASASQIVTLPDIPELFNEKFLDVLIPAKEDDYDMVVDGPNPDTPVNTPKNPMMEALKSTANHTWTTNNAPALSSTESATLDAFNGISDYTDGPLLASYLSNAWAEDPQLTLRIIWSLRSIPDGKSNREAFYRAFAWLFDEHPRTAVLNLPLLVEPVSYKPKTKRSVSHGYWKDLLNILALATVGELSPSVSNSTFLHHPREPFSYGRSKKARVDSGDTAQRIEAHLARNAQRKEEARVQRVDARASSYERLVGRLAEPKFRALYIAVARLFSQQLVHDMSVLHRLPIFPQGERPTALPKTISLAGKWAPTPLGSHDRVTNISSAIALLLSKSLPVSFPSILKEPLEQRDKILILRSFFQRWILRPLREAIQCPEPLMASDKWKEINYSRIPSICMKNNTEHFYKHDPERFQEYLIAVESGKKAISGATLLPHEIIAQVFKLGQVTALVEMSGKKVTMPALREFRKGLAKTQLRVAEAQWKTLISNLRASGSLDNAIAICDVSGSMGSIFGKYNKKYVQPILPAVSLSLVLASLATPPFNGGFITFSSHPKFEKLDLEGKSLYETVEEIVCAEWGMNTDLRAVFLDLLLPLAIRNGIKQEDMIKRLFIFSDMQFDAAAEQGRDASSWDTNYDVIEKAYKAAGYEVPEIVYWDLNATGVQTVEVLGSRKGVAMMNGFSPALLKVFMGEADEDAEEWEQVGEDGEVVKVKAEEEFNPVNVMKKALLRKSFDGLVVVD